MFHKHAENGRETAVHCPIDDMGAFTFTAPGVPANTLPLLTAIGKLDPEVRSEHVMLTDKGVLVDERALTPLWEKYQLSAGTAKKGLWRRFRAALTVTPFMYETEGASEVGRIILESRDASVSGISSYTGALTPQRRFPGLNDTIFRRTHPLIEGMGVELSRLRKKLRQ